MVQLLIVDDEIHVVERLTSTIDWSGVGVEQVYGVHSAEEALALLERMSIDIVLTDIRMPGLSGLQLIGEIRRRWPKTKCILLSGFSDFQYAKEAILHQSEDYLLKPVTERDLVDTVRRVMDKMKREWEEVVSKQRLAYTLKEHLPLLRGNLLNDLLQGRKLSHSSLSDKMQMLEMTDFNGKRFALMTIRLEEYFLQYDAHSLSLMEYAIGNMVEELFGGRFDSWYAKDAHDYLVFVLTGKPGMDGTEDSVWLERTASLLQAAVNRYLKGKISVLVSRWGTFPADLFGLYSRSVEAFRRTVGSEQELFLRLDDEPLSTEIESLQTLYEPPSFIHLLEAARWDGIEEKLKSVFAELEQRYAESQEHLLEAYFCIASAYAYIAHKGGRRLSSVIGADYDKMTRGTPFRSVNQLKEWSLLTLNRIREDMARDTQHSRASVINDIRSFVEQRISEDVSLQSIADYVHLHPVYVSKIYKLETGDNLSDYVHRVRMDKAEYMLRSGQDKIYEIAARLGYQRPHSFNHAFKKQFGMTPQEYRDTYS